ncbi:MAG TPA: glycosyltransferase family 87 protein [Blastocatellia bacterium]
MNSNKQSSGQSKRVVIIEASIYLLAAVSLIYAVATAPGRAIDIGLFYEGAQSWADGTHKIGSGAIALYPPFTFPLLSPLALFSFDRLVIVFILINLAVTALATHLAIKLWGADWPIRTRMLFAAMLILWAPWRVMIRNGQISIIIVALLLGALAARKKNKHFLAGALLGLTLTKYTMTFPFFLYFAWKREWKIILASLLLPVALMEVYALRMGTTMIASSVEYARFVAGVHSRSPGGWIGTTEIKPMIASLTGGNEQTASIITIILILAAMVAFFAVVARKPKCEDAHFALMTLFALWAAYHRTYDSVICLVPAAALISFYRRNILARYSLFWLGALQLFIINLPGLLADRLHLGANDSLNPAAFLGLHIERLMVMVFFWSLVWSVWKWDAAGNESIRDDS